MNLYTALLRGINVGGKNLIKMPELAACFTAQGFGHVQTYIQSGNVIFSARETDQTSLEIFLEETLAQAFNYPARLVLRSYAQMGEIVGRAPEGFGSDPAAYRYDVIYLKGTLSSAAAMESLSTKPGVDRAYAGNGVLYFSRLISKASQSRLTRIISLPIYQELTIRNWNTTTRLLRMMEDITNR